MTYGEAFTVQPFGNSLVTKTMTGDMIRRLLQQQFLGCGGPGPDRSRILQISAHVPLRAGPRGGHLRGQDRADVGRTASRCNATDSFRVTMNNFLATGGDGFTVFNEGTDALGGAQDIDAWVEYFEASEPAGIAVPPLDRIVALT